MTGEDKQNNIVDYLQVSAATFEPYECLECGKLLVWGEHLSKVCCYESAEARYITCKGCKLRYDLSQIASNGYCKPICLRY